MLSRPPSPSLDPPHVDPTFYNPIVDQSQSQDSIMGRPPLHNTLDILLHSEPLIFRGTGIDVEPACLRGTVVLHLVEATAFKEITMQFRGKSRVPNLQSDGHGSSVLGSSYQTNVFFTHDWSFLEGGRKHTPTLKAGRHVFPFHLELDGNLPSSLSVHGGLAGVYYKLRATAVRPVFATNLHAATSVHIVRSFASTALEYQQTLEVENTWPEKLMYSLMVPHKAWAAGDTVTTLVKFSPLVKGVHIRSVTSSVQEHLKIFGSKTASPHEETRTITTAKHEIHQSGAVTLQLNDPSRHRRVNPPPWSTPAASPLYTPSSERTDVSPFDAIDPTTVNAQPILSGVPVMNYPPTPDASSSRSLETEHVSTDDNIDLGEEEVVTTLPLTLAASSTPSHTVEPFTLSHRIRWNILISNPDGHTSELRCSLPLCILDRALLDEARIATSATRRLLFGLEDAQSNGIEELELPSYPAHVLDRVANAYVPATIHVSNPWVNHPGAPQRRPSFAPGSAPFTPPLTPGESPVALDWVNSELHRRPGRGSAATTPPESTPASHHASRGSSRSGSPERGTRSHHHSIFSLRSFSKVTSSLHPKDTHRQAAAAAAADTPSSPSPPPPAAATQPSSSNTTPTHEVPSLGEQLSRAFNTVPHYDIASRGFLGGGVTPLSSMRGLPSYEEAERSQSDGDLATRFAAAAAARTQPLS